MATRNLAIEKNSVDTFAKEKRRLPTSAQDWAEIHKMSYPSVNDLPDELKNATTLSYYGATGSPGSAVRPPNTPQTPLVGNPLSQTPAGSVLSSLGQQKEQAFGRVQELGSGNEAIRVLQEAVKAKTGVAQAPIGESAIFKQAGVSGIGALGASLNARGQEIATNAATFQNIIGQMAGTYKDMANTALFAYQEKAKEYSGEVARLQKIEDDARNFEQQIDLLNKQHQNDLELKRLQQRYDLATSGSGLVFDNSGNIVTDVSGADADAVANAILTVESGGNFNAAGGSGENGRFQFMPATWNIISQQYAQANGINQSLRMTPENEDKVARWKIGQLLASGNSPQDVALIWNTSLGGAEKPFVRKGVNDKGISYDSGAYAQKVMNVLRQNVGSSGSANSEAERIAADIFSGSSNQKLGDISTKNNLRSNVSTALTKLKAQALATGDIQGVIRASAGGKDVDATTATSFEKAVSVLNQIEDLKKTIEKEATGPIQGIIRSNNPYDTKAQLIKAQLSSIVPGLARGVYGEVGVLTDADIENYAKTLPNLRNTEDVTSAVLAMTVKSIQNSLETKIKVQAGLGRDVSGIGNVYADVKAKADALSAQSGSGTPSEVGSYLDSLNLK